MTPDHEAFWLGADIVALRGASVIRVFAALELEARRAKKNGLPLPADLQWDLAVLRAAADAARGRTKRATSPPADQGGFAGEPSGFAGSPSSVSPPDAELMDTSQVAAELFVSPQHARTLCRKRFRTAQQVGGVWVVAATEVRAYAAAQRQKESA